jgi:uncharacterized phage-like protein YoqJ
MKLACITYRLPDVEEFHSTGPKSVLLYDTLEAMMTDYKVEDVEIITGLNPGQDMILPWLGEQYKLPILAILPYTSYGGVADGWTAYDEGVYKEMLEYNDLTVTYSSSGHRKPWKEDHKNRRIIEISDVIVFFGENEHIKLAKEFAKYMNKETLTINLPKKELV